MNDKERLEEIDQIVDDLLNNRLELSNFVSEHLSQAERVEEQQQEIEELKKNLNKEIEVGYSLEGQCHDFEKQLSSNRKEMMNSFGDLEMENARLQEENEQLNEDLQLQKDVIARWAKQYQHSQEKFDIIRGLINDTELGLGDDCTLDCEEAIEQIQKVLEAEG